jgi:hypothetical protein
MGNAPPRINVKSLCVNHAPTAGSGIGQNIVLNEVVFQNRLDALDKAIARTMEAYGSIKRAAAPLLVGTSLQGKATDEVLVQLDRMTSELRQAVGVASILAGTVEGHLEALCEMAEGARCRVASLRTTLPAVQPPQAPTSPPVVETPQERLYADQPQPTPVSLDVTSSPANADPMSSADAQLQARAAALADQQQQGDRIA